MLKEISIGGVSLAALAYAAFSVFYLGPTVGQRVGMADHLNFCRNHHAAWVRESRDLMLSKLPRPKNGVELDIARKALNSPLMKMAEGMSRYGLAPGQQNPIARIIGIDPMSTPHRIINEAKNRLRSAQAAYEQASSAIKAKAHAQLLKTNDTCKQAIAQAVGKSIYEWGAFAGSGGLISLAPVSNFRNEIKIALGDIVKG